MPVIWRNCSFRNPKGIEKSRSMNSLGTGLEEIWACPLFMRCYFDILENQLDHSLKLTKWGDLHHPLGLFSYFNNSCLPEFKAFSFWMNVGKIKLSTFLMLVSMHRGIERKQKMLHYLVLFGCNLVQKFFHHFYQIQ